jgi:hypothetical protein
MQHEDEIHELWLLYCQLKDSECAAEDNGKILVLAEQLGRVINRLNRACCQPKSPGTQADNLNCRQRQKGLTPDTCGTQAARASNSPTTHRQLSIQKTK